MHFRSIVGHTVPKRKFWPFAIQRFQGCRQFRCLFRLNRYNRAYHETELELFLTCDPTNKGNLKSYCNRFYHVALSSLKTFSLDFIIVEVFFKPPNRSPLA